MSMTKLFVPILMVILIAGCAAGAGAAQPAATAVANQALARDVDPATVKSLLGKPDVVVLDVREQSEYKEGHIPGVKLIPLGEVEQRLSEIPKDKTVIVTCRSGNRSSQATNLLSQKGYTNVHNMVGGILAWQSAGYPVDR